MPEQPADLAWGDSDYRMLYINRHHLGLSPVDEDTRFRALSRTLILGNWSRESSERSQSKGRMMRHKDNSARTNRPDRRGFAFLLAVVLCVLFTDAAALDSKAPAVASSEQAIATIHIDAAHPLKTFDPDIALGTSIDILPQGVVDKIYTPEILKESLSAGWGPITYRQNTELQGAAWHWNPHGTWSDAAHQSGYFTGSAELGEPIRHSLAYPLPLRGNTGG